MFPRPISPISERGLDRPPVQLTLFPEFQPWGRWVLRRHQATWLHYDFRLEVLGTLWSFASEEPLSLDPRRAVRLRVVGDHDPRYLLAERRIPEGQYGAGPTMPVDEGRYGLRLKTYSTNDLEMLNQMARGEIHLLLQGHVLNGEWRLLGRDRDWTIRKLPDEYATDAPPALDRSIVTGRRLEDL